MALGAKFAKWRAVITIGADGRPSEACIHANAHALARYAALCQESGVVPIVEPEVLMDGDHTIERCHEATVRTQRVMYAEMEGPQGVHFAGTILKASMVLSGKDCPERAGGGRGGRAHRRVPARRGARLGAGGGVPVRRTERDPRDRALERDERDVGRAALGAQLLLRARAPGPGPAGVAGTAANAKRAQDLLVARERLNALACLGRYTGAMEEAA